MGENGQIEGKAGPVSPPHHEGFDKALEEAVARAAEDPSWSPGETRTFSLELSVEIAKTNPGWIGGYSCSCCSQVRW